MTDTREKLAPYDQAIADELRGVAASIGGSDSTSGLMIMGLVDEYEMAPGGPRAHLRRPDTREEFARIAESRRKPPISASNIGYNCAINEMVAELRALPSVCGGEDTVSVPGTLTLECEMCASLGNHGMVLELNGLRYSCDGQHSEEVTLADACTAHERGIQHDRS